MAKKKEQPKAKDTKAKPLPRKKTFYFDFEGESYSLTYLQKQFCDYYLDPALSGADAIIKAGYKVKEDNRHLARVMSTENLIKPNVKAYLKMMLDQVGLDEVSVAKAHAYLIDQRENESGISKGVDMFYKLTGKYSADKVEHSVNKDLKEAISRITNALPD